MLSSALIAPSCNKGPGLPVRIVLITIDTLRYDGLHSSTGDTSVMPKTSALADTGTVFSRHYSASSTTQPTHASLFTGLHPWQHGVTRNGVVLKADLVTVTERLKSAGYGTAAVVASFPLHHLFGFDQGFDVYDDSFTERPIKKWEGIEGPPGQHFYKKAYSVTDAAVELLRRPAGRNQFYWFHYFDPHSPYGDLAGHEFYRLTNIRSQLRLPETRMQAVEKLPDLRRAYDSDLSALDDSLAVLFREIFEGEERFETHVIVVSDHGESFGEQGSIGHGTRLTDEQIHVPCFILSSRLEQSEINHPTASVDIAATILSLAGLHSDQSVGIDLTGPLDNDRPVLGMRKTVPKDRNEIRTDGTRHALKPFLFYLVEGDSIYRGNSQRVDVEGGVARVPSDFDRAATLFESFEDELRSKNVLEIEDTATKSALEALGYVN